MQIFGADILGIDGRLVRLTATKNPGQSGTALLGLAQKVVKEGYTRASKAIETLDGDWSSILKHEGYTIAFSPAELNKNSSGLDLPIAIQLLVASVLQNLDMLNEGEARIREKLETLGTGERADDKRKRLLLELEAIIRSLRLAKEYRDRIRANTKKYLLIGTLDIVSGEVSQPEFGMFGLTAAAKAGFTVIIPEDSEVYGALVQRRRSQINVYRVRDLQEVWDVILGLRTPRKARISKKRIFKQRFGHHIPDLNEIDGVIVGKRAMEVALAGGHNILLVGPPGHGKTMLAQAATGLLPDLTPDEMFEVNQVHSAANLLGENETIVRRPFYEAHGGVTKAKLLGGGRRPRPGLVSLAHHGVLLLDEINLFPPALLEELRTPLNNRSIQIQRVSGTLSYPSHFTLVAAMNPCHCGWYGHYACSTCGKPVFGNGSRCPEHPQERPKAKCICSRNKIESYRGRLSGPLLDRIDLKVFVSDLDQRRSRSKVCATSTVRRGITRARELQQLRYKDIPFVDCNADIPNRAQYDHMTKPLSRATADYLDAVYRRLSLTKRMEVKLLLVARTISDLENVQNVRQKDIREAITLMGLDSSYLSGLVGG